jgi:hypothetical protein
MRAIFDGMSEPMIGMLEDPFLHAASAHVHDRTRASLLNRRAQDSLSRHESKSLEPLHR